MDLTELRKEIDGIDRQLVTLLERRMDVSVGVAEYKRAHGLPVLDTGREAEKLTAVRAMCRPATAGPIAGVFQAIMDASKTYQTLLMERDHG